MNRTAGGLRVTLLGTGSPSPTLVRHHPAALVEWGPRSSILVDVGDGVVIQLLAAGSALADVEHVAITHLHWDHVLGYPAFVWGSWSAGRSRLRVIGPTGTADMHQRVVEDFYRAQAEWAIDLGYRRAGWDDVEVLDIEAGWSTELDGCVVEAGRVVHPLIARLHSFHASPQDCVDMAADAGVSKVVLTHHLPETRPQFARSGYEGEVLIGRDLDVIVA